MEFIDLKIQQKRIQDTLNRNIKKVLNHGIYIMGPEVKQLEAKLTAYTGTKHAIRCASGTDALLMALMSYGVKPGDAIFTTPLHRQTAFAFLAYQTGSFPFSEDTAKRIFSLPMHPYLTQQEQTQIAEVIKG